VKAKREELFFWVANGGRRRKNCLSGVKTMKSLVIIHDKFQKEMFWLLFM
jgi:hypothetical protein